jgi:putative transposase
LIKSLTIFEKWYYIDERYGVIYRSKQSYYELFKKAKISWHKSQKCNPKHDSDLVDEKKRSDLARVSRARERSPTKRFSFFLKQNWEAIESEELAVFFIDECHLLWGDVCGYMWGQTNFLNTLEKF